MEADRALFIELLGHCERVADLAKKGASYHAGYRAGRPRERVDIKAIIRTESLAAAALICTHLEKTA